MLGHRRWPEHLSFAVVINHLFPWHLLFFTCHYCHRPSIENARACRHHELQGRPPRPTASSRHVATIARPLQRLVEFILQQLNSEESTPKLQLLRRLQRTAHAEPADRFEQKLQGIYSTTWSTIPPSFIVRRQREGRLFPRLVFGFENGVFRGTFGTASSNFSRTAISRLRLIQT